MKAKGNIKEGDTVIFNWCPYHRRPSDHDGEVLMAADDFVTVIYMSGLKGYTDDIPYDRIIAKVDQSKPRVKLDGVTYEGHFEVFE